MSLPSITLPAGTPVFLSVGHAIEPRPVFADVPMQTGHLRKRRVFTTAPRVVTVQLLLNQVQMTAVDDWYENTLIAGQREFSAQVANQGPGLLWWTASWVEPYTAEPLGNGWWRLTGSLLITGTGQVERPYTSGLAANVTVRLSGSATLTVGKPLSADVTVALT